jgi:signal transduction histidine kinase/CheY-like chemotaxis protein/HPt (histidine-containing phosphotransfer) domain-containing protein
MQFLRRWSIRQKLIALSMISTGVALLAACGILAFYDYRQIKTNIETQWVSYSTVVGENSTAAITFNDSDAATSYLKSLSQESELEVAAIYSESGAVLAHYVRPGYQGGPPANLDFSGSRFGPGSLEVAQPVTLNGKEIGRTYVRCDLHELNEHMRDFSAVILFVLAGTLAGAYLLVSRLQRVISGPILSLTGAVREVASSKDYSVRVGRGENSGDELGVLVNGFDEMLGELQQRDLELTRHREHLEKEVATRTNELRATNAALVKSKEKAEEASAAKSAFLANMSHEIRTPMTAIVGYADMMLEPDQTLSDRQDALQTIRRNARHLLDLINDILDISKIEAHKMTVERAPADVPAMLSDLLSLMRPRAIAKGLDFHLDVPGEIPQTIQTDPLRLRQVLLNLLGNSVKFTEKGEIRLRVSCERSGDEGIMRFDVQDTGIGIRAETLQRLFQPFSQADESMTRRFGGTGLGLTISRQLTTLLGGEVSVESEEGRGSTFTVRVGVGSLSGVKMLSGVTEAILPKPTSAAQREWKVRARILLVEDGLDNQRLISMHLRKAGADVTIADNGRIGVDKAVAAQAENPFELILMDMQMPELDGYGAASELRRRGFETPIIALTAHAMFEDREKCLRAGCTDYLTKPIEKNLLLGTVAAHLKAARAGLIAIWTNGARGATAAVPKPAAAEKIHSEFAEDQDMREILGEFIAQLPVQVARMNDMLEQGNMADLRRAVHQLKGAGGGYGFPVITDQAATAEKLIKASASVEAVTSQVRDLIAVIESIEGYAGATETSNAAENTGH